MHIYEKFKKEWEKRNPTGLKKPEEKTPVGTLFSTILSTYRWYYVGCTIMAILLSLFEFANAQILYFAIKALKGMTSDTSYEEKAKNIGLLILALFGTKIGTTLLTAQNQFVISFVGQRVRNGLNGLIYQKLLQKSLGRDGTFSLGELTNLTQNDTRNFANMGNYAARIIILPLEICVGLVWLYFLVGNALWPALTVLILMTFINIYLSSIYKKASAGLMEVSDRRGKLITEVFTNIRYVKMNGLEDYYLTRILEVKNEELGLIKKLYFRSLATISLNNSGPVFFLCALFSFYMYFNGILELELVFTVMQIFAIFSWNFASLPAMLIWILDMLISARRICFFLLSEKIEDDYIAHDKEGTNMDDVAIRVENGSFYWEDKELKKHYQAEKDRIGDKKDWAKKKPKKQKKQKKNKQKKNKEKKNKEKNKKNLQSLEIKSNSNKDPLRENLLKNDVENSEANSQDWVTNTSQAMSNFESEKYNMVLKKINLEIPKGQCVALIGKVGCGKSSLLQSLLGELYNDPASKISLSGRIAYVSQKAWIPSKTIKDVIIFGEEFNEKKYQDSIRYACMEDDLRILEKGDQTMLGDKGINLSGGQKTRLSLARAFYSNRDIYLLDDPISALDIHVGKAVMENGIIDYLKGKTRVVATHAIAYLKLFDYIYVLDKGEIIEEGTYDEILQSPAYQEIEKSLKVEEEKEQEKKRKDSMASRDSLELDLEKELSKNENQLKKQKSLEDQRKSSEHKDQKETQGDADEETQGEKDDSKPKTKMDRVVEDIITVEDRAKGHISFGIVLEYIKMGGGYKNLFFVAILTGCYMFTNGINPWFLQYWASNHDKEEKGDIENFFFIYSAICVTDCIFTFSRACIIYMANVRVAREVNFLMTFKLMHASINNFFDRVPLGRIMNRFMKDCNIIDRMLGYISSYTLFTG